MKRFVHKAALLFTVILLLSLVLPISALADGETEGDEFTQTVNGYQVTLVFEKPVAIGENQIHVLINDSQNLPVPQADLEVSVVDVHSEHVEALSTADVGMNVMAPNPTEDSGMAGMPGMSAQPTEESSMAGMPGMSGMSAEQPTQAPAVTHDQMGMAALTAGPKSGEYDGQVAIEKAGDLIMRVHLTIDGNLMEVDFPLHVTKSITGPIVLTSFFAVNVAVIAAAVVMKPKRVSVDLSKKA